MKAAAWATILMFLLIPLAGCVTNEEIEEDFIEDESELLNPEDAGYCGDLDGDGELDCPLTGYIPETTPWW